MKKILSLILFLAGILFLVNSQSNITGAVVGVSVLSPLINSIIGFILIISSGFLFMANSGGKRDLEFIITTNITDKALQRYAKKALKNQQVKREMEHLEEELKKGNLEAGLGRPGHVNGTDINYMRGENGARLFYRRIGENTYQIVGKASGVQKKGNETQVYNKLIELYTKN
jgi:uncharacterized membrane protein